MLVNKSYAFLASFAYNSALSDQDMSAPYWVYPLFRHEFERSNSQSNYISINSFREQMPSCNLNFPSPVLLRFDHQKTNCSMKGDASSCKPYCPKCIWLPGDADIADHLSVSPSGRLQSLSIWPHGAENEAATATLASSDATHI